MIFYRPSVPILPLRGLARSHRYCTHVRPDALSAGAGKPAKRPVRLLQVPWHSSCAPTRCRYKAAQTR
ncbi:hypothetical protein C1X73_01140 [Pseudomonas sp. FW305-130]|nr:hypothetical protein C1X74_12410 [Pseudomonas sp. GW460-5]PNB62941.1 hypothetical protein C1X73_01140 [Pseudomonas sp. FW305-130]